MQRPDSARIWSYATRGSERVLVPGARLSGTLLTERKLSPVCMPISLQQRQRY